MTIGIILYSSLFFLKVLEFELRALCLQKSILQHEPSLQPISGIGYFSDSISWTSLRQWSSDLCPLYSWIKAVHHHTCLVWRGEVLLCFCLLADSRNFLIYSIITSVTHCFFRSVLFSLHVFDYFLCLTQLQQGLWLWSWRLRQLIMT
jgi:hypothetical protein